MIKHHLSLKNLTFQEIKKFIEELKETRKYYEGSNKFDQVLIKTYNESSKWSEKDLILIFEGYRDGDLKKIFKIRNRKRMERLARTGKWLVSIGTALLVMGDLFNIVHREIVEIFISLGATWATTYFISDYTSEDK